MNFEYNLNKKNNIILVKLSGELIDRSQALELLADIEVCMAKGENKILLNLVDLRYVNSNGLDILINILTKARKSGGDAAICSVNKKINDLLVITKLDSIFNISADEAQALEKLNK